MDLGLTKGDIESSDSLSKWESVLMDYGWTVEEDGSLKSPAPSEETLGGEYSTPLKI